MRSLVALNLNNYRVGGERSGALTIAVLETWFEAMTRTNQAWMLANKDAPLLYNSGVRYAMDPERSKLGIGELWLDAPSVLSRGQDDCEGLSSFLAAEMRTRDTHSEGRGRRPAATVKLKTTRIPGLLHAIVIDLATGERFDPSRRLGMGKKHV